MPEPSPPLPEFPSPSVPGTTSLYPNMTGNNDYIVLPNPGKVQITWTPAPGDVAAIFHEGEPCTIPLGTTLYTVGENALIRITRANPGDRYIFQWAYA